MAAVRQAASCLACGAENPPGAAYCAACGVALTGPGSGTGSLENAVDGAPVPSVPPSLGQELTQMRDRLSYEVRDRWNSELRDHLRQRMRQHLQRRVPGLGTTLAESIARLSGLAAADRRPGAPAAPPNLPPWPFLRTWAPPSGAQLAPLAPPIAARVLWFVLAGSWLTLLWILATWVTMCTVAGVPVARRMLDLVPTVLTLRPAQVAMRRWQGQRLLLRGSRAVLPRQHDLPTRAAYFLFIGWWASLTWMLVSYAVSLTGIGLPLAYKMFELTPTVTHLERR